MNSDTKNLAQGVAFVLVGAFCFSLAIPFTRWTHDLGTPVIVFWRAFFGFLFLLTLVTRDHEPLRYPHYRHATRRLLLLGFCVVLTVIFYTYAVQHTTAAIAVLLVNSAPIYVALLSPWLLNEPRSPYTWISLGMALVGMALLTDLTQLGGASGDLSGVIAAALSGLTYGSVMMVSRSLRGSIQGLTQNLWAMGLIVLIMIPFALSAPLDTLVDNLPVLIPLGVFSLGMSYMFYFLGLARVSAQVVSVVSLSESVFGVMMGVIFFAEVPNVLGWLGGALILVSIYLISRPSGAVIGRRQRI
ncbi:MAG: EamA family transporter [Anaerolineae bacterium]|nr:EamA family transporter [Anaerolineae bacterium]